MACDFNKFCITNIRVSVLLLIIQQDNTVVCVLHNFDLHGNKKCAVVHFNIVQAHVSIMLLRTAMIHMSVSTQSEHDYLYVT